MNKGEFKILLFSLIGDDFNYKNVTKAFGTHYRKRFS